MSDILPLRAAARALDIQRGYNPAIRRALRQLDLAKVFMDERHYGPALRALSRAVAQLRFAMREGERNGAA